MNDKIPEKLKATFSGFEELLDLMEDRNPQRHQREEKIGKEYDIQSFLETEKDRLEKLYSFLNSKAKIFNEFPQIEPLKEIQETEIIRKKKEISKNLNNIKGPFLNNLSFLYTQFFPEINEDD